MVLHIGHRVPLSLNDVVGIFNRPPGSVKRTGILLTNGEWVESDLASEALVGRVERLQNLFAGRRFGDEGQEEE